MDWNQHFAEVHAFLDIDIKLFRASVFENGKCGALEEIPRIAIKHRKMSFQTPEDVEILDALHVDWDSFKVQGSASEEEAFLRMIDTGRCYVEVNPGHLISIHKDPEKRGRWAWNYREAREGQVLGIDFPPGFYILRLCYGGDRFWYINPHTGQFGPLAIDTQLLDTFYGFEVFPHNIKPITFLLKNLPGNPIPLPQLKDF